MIGIDTNVLVRFCAQDDPIQAQKATAFLSSLTVDEPGYVTTTAVVELVSVLSRKYGMDRPMLAVILENLLRTQELVIERSGVCWEALHLYRTSKADFADCLIARFCQAAGCDHTVTFDVAASRLVGFRLLK